MKKILLLVVMAFFLSGCMAANIITSVVPNVIDIGKRIAGKEYELATSKAKFIYFDENEQTILPPFRHYFVLLSKKREYIGFAASESNDKNDCFIGFRIYKDSVDADIELLNQFINWSEQNPSEAITQNITLKMDSKKTVNLSFTTDKDKHTPLLIYSGKNCDFFTKTKYYALTPDNAKQIIAEITAWKNL